jgi:hypothetical protein
MSTEINLVSLNKKNVASTMIDKSIPTSPLKIDNTSEKILATTTKGSAVVHTGYNKGKPNLNAPSVTLFTRGIGTENDNVEIDPSLILNPKTVQHATIPSVAVSSCTDVRLRSYGSDYVANNRSAVMLNADVVQHRGNEVIELVVGNSAYRTAGSRIGSSGGVHLLKAGKEKQLQPMVLGNNLATTLIELTDFVNNLSTRIIEIRKDLILMKTFLMAHVHIATGPGAPTSPSPDLIATLGTSLVSDSLEVSNGLSNLINLEIYKVNHLYPFSSEKIVSSDHKLT